MNHATVEAYAIVSQGIGRTWYVKGIGMDPPSAWDDTRNQANYIYTTLDFIRERPELKLVKCTMKLSFDGNKAIPSITRTEAIEG